MKMKYFLFSILLFMQYSSTLSSRCFFQNPKLGEFHPSVELEVVTKEIYPQKNASIIIIRCKATAPVVNSQTFNPILLNPSVVMFFFNGRRLSGSTCEPSSESTKKICKLVIHNPREENYGMYYCMARNGIRCTTIGANVRSTQCARPDKKIDHETKDFFQQLLKQMKCLQRYKICCIAGSNCKEDYVQCLKNPFTKL